MSKSVRVAAGLILVASLGFVGVRATGRKAPATPEPEPQPAVSVASAQASVSPPQAPPPTATQPLTDVERILAGGPVPSLPSDAPHSVRFGAILFTYAGAELTGKSARPKEEAYEKAKEIIAKAVDDFAEAAKHGDPGSSADVGSIPQGVLEPPLEYLLFTLDKRKVFPEPIDTPRGYWVVKRLP